VTTSNFPILSSGELLKFANERQTLLKNIDTPDPEISVTPRWLSPVASGYYIAKGRGVLDLIPHPKPKFKRAKPRRRVRGVAIPRDLQPWRLDEQ
jgi:hypothetical protein